MPNFCLRVAPKDITIVDFRKPLLHLFLRSKVSHRVSEHTEMEANRWLPLLSPDPLVLWRRHLLPVKLLVLVKINVVELFEPVQMDLIRCHFVEFVGWPENWVFFLFPDRPKHDFGRFLVWVKVVEKLFGVEIALCSFFEELGGGDFVLPASSDAFLHTL
jgi:hypothetical protein